MQSEASESDTESVREPENEQAARSSSLSSTVSMTLSGFESEEAAHKFAGTFQTYLYEIGRVIDLERLDWVTVAYDYSAALAAIDRGVPGTAQLTATSENYGTGVAMTPAVLREGIVKAHMVYNANVVRQIEQEALNRDVLYLIAHECGHVHDLKARDTAFPGILLRTNYTNLRQSALGGTAAACWDEYAACFISAQFSTEQTTASLAEIFIGATRAARQNANAAIRKYRRHGDVRQVVADVVGQYGNTLKFASYLLGQLHGSGLTLSDCSIVTSFISGHWIEPYINRLDAELSALMCDYGEWKQIAEFDCLQCIADDLFKEGGIAITEISAEEVYVTVPFTPDTT